MHINSFNDIVNEEKNKRPIIFGLESDAIPSTSFIESIEKYYCIALNKQYCEFLLTYGGGYFAFTVVYSMDSNSSFFVKNKVSTEFIKKHDFFPVIDLETGDTVGFKINNNICDELLSIYNHEDDKLTELNIDFFEGLIKYGLRLT